MTELKKKWVYFVFVALIVGSIFAGMVSADVDNVSGSNLVNESYSEWGSKPVMVNVQVNLETEGDQDYVYGILNETEEQEWHATVFVTGEFASNHPDIVRDLDEREHQIAVYGWECGEDLTLFNYTEQFDLINRSFSAVRSAANNSEYIVDFKPQGYNFNNDTLIALQEFGAESISGLFECDEPFCKCWYAQSLGEITFPYPITTDFWAIPISTIEVDSENVLLDDSYIFNITDSSSDYLDYLLQGYNERNETKDPLIIAVHPSITGADSAKLNALSQFLDHVKDTGGKVATLENIRHFTDYITDLDVTGPSSACPGETVTITVTYTSNLWCPTYYFRAYGRYPSEKTLWLFPKWRQHDQHSEYVYLGTHTFSMQVTIPEPPEPGDEAYTIRVAGRACGGANMPCWPKHLPGCLWLCEEKEDLIVDITKLELEVKNGLTQYEGDYKEKVFRRGEDKPKFEVKVVNGEVPGGGEVIVDIFRKGEEPIKTLTAKKKSAGKYEAVWGDWKSNEWADSEIPDKIPVGKYKAQAKIKKDNKKLCPSEKKEFYVIFNSPEGLSDAEKKAYLYSSSKKDRYIKGNYYGKRDYTATKFFEREYYLEPVDEHIFNISIHVVDSITEETTAAEKLRTMSYNIIKYSKPHTPRDVPIMFKKVSVEDAIKASKGQKIYKIKGQCLDYGNALTSVLRSVGIGARPATGIWYKHDCWLPDYKKEWAYHVWTETYVPEAPGDDAWYVYDGTLNSQSQRISFNWGKWASEVAVGNKTWKADGGILKRTDCKITRHNIKANDILFEKCENKKYSDTGCSISPSSSLFKNYDTSALTTERRDIFTKTIAMGMISSAEYLSELSSNCYINLTLDKYVTRVTEPVVANITLTNDEDIDMIFELNFSIYVFDPASPIMEYDRVVEHRTINVIIPSNGNITLQQIFSINTTNYPLETHVVEVIGKSENKICTAIDSLEVLPAYDMAITLPNNISVQDQIPIALTICNKISYSIENISILVDIPVEYSASDELTKDIPLLTPEACVEYTLIIAPVKENFFPILSLYLTVNSDNGGNYSISLYKELIEEPELDMEDEHIPFFGEFGEPFEIYFAVSNIGDLTATNVLAEITLPENVTATETAWNIGDLTGGENVTVYTNITCNLTEDFAIDVFAYDDAGHNASGIIWIDINITVPPPAEFTDTYLDYGVDTDGDGLYNYLRIEAGINVTEAGDYTLEGYLEDSDGDFIGSGSNYVNLGVGIHSVALDLDGMPIDQHGVNGPYNLSLVELYDADLSLVDYQRDAYTTSAYAYTDFQQGGVITGTVRDYNGILVPHAYVDLIGAAYDSTMTDINGIYNFTGLQTGTYTIEVTPSDPNLKSGSALVSVVAGETSVLDFTLQQAGSIAGNVTDADGAPVPDVHLYLSGYEPPRYQTNENGTYLIPELEDGTYTLNIDAPDYGSWYIFINNSYTRYDTSVDIEITPGQTTVVNFTQQPPPSPNIWVNPESFEVTLPQGEITMRTMTIGNDGDDVLEFEITDQTGVSIIDPREGGLVDIKQVFANVDATDVNFMVETYSSITETWAWGYMWLDTDRNPATGATANMYPGYGLNDIGADYYVYIDLYSEYAYLYRWTDYEFIAYLPLSLNAYHFSFSIPLSDIADDGIMDMTLMMSYYYGTDTAPDEGHGTTGIGVEWLTESPTTGTVDPDSQMDITITIDATDLEVDDYSASIVINSNDIDEGTVVIPVYSAVEEAGDTIPPVIESVTLDVYTTIPDAAIHVTVNATDNVGVTSVTADGVALVENGSTWEGNITAPSATGIYTLTIRAEDAAGNIAETVADYSVVKPSGSIGIGVDPRLTTVRAGDTAVITIKLVSTENFDDVAYVYLTTEGVYPGYEANLTWFNWTSGDVKVPAGAEVNVPLEANIPAGESGYKIFYAKLESTKWTPTAMDTGILYII